MGILRQGVLVPMRPSFPTWLLQVRVEPFEKPENGYKIVFAFSENLYFEEEELSKEVHFVETEMGPIPLICRVTGCQPTWKEEVSVAVWPSLSCIQFGVS